MRIFSAASERQGRTPIPPMAKRMLVNLPPWIFAITAVELSANSYEARSRSFKYKDLVPDSSAGNETPVISSPG
ncbi:hypothetical protein D3C87_1876190 [compost metagenome]